VLSSFVYRWFASLSYELLFSIHALLLRRSATIMLGTSSEVLAERRDARGAGVGDWFKRHLSIAEECALYQEGACELTRRGYPISVIDGSGPADDVGRQIANLIESMDEARQCAR
jgi:thymidylate kinase